MKRSILFAVLAAVVLVAGVVLYSQFGNQNPISSSVTSDSSDDASSNSTPAASSVPAQEADASTTSTQDLMAPGPLPDQAVGDANAPITIIEYASLTCPHCAHFHETTYPELKKRYIDTGKVRFIFREFPLDNYATAGFMLARCGGDGKYFPILEAFFNKQEELMKAANPFDWIQGFGKQVGFTQESLDSCLSNQQLLDSVMAVRQRAAEKLGVSSTPTFFINGKVKRGAMTIEELDKELEPLLRS
ncbi:DsbA family protein [Flaviflagellibacter deserti]|uniref:DsbA family protein n=1 Tax=Flaviflagellibacter deserti TaxID=2267266 RepID=A0ABV9YV63_9HYPH